MQEQVIKAHPFRVGLSFWKKENSMAESSLDKAMKKMAAMGVTISVTPAPGVPEGFEDRPFGLIAEAAKKHGIYEEKN